eukprot:scaffold36829_cov29-Tisochrysis_lutea.AAC.4
MGNGSSAPADHPLHEARKGKWEEYFKKMKASRKWSVNDANPKVGEHHLLSTSRPPALAPDSAHSRCAPSASEWVDGAPLCGSQRLA